jgi:hypothetical protein
MGSSADQLTQLANLEIEPEAMVAPFESARFARQFSLTSR